MVPRPALPLLSEKHFPHGGAPANPSDLVAYCDPHDLIAIATETHDVVVYRITGHPAFTIKRRNGDPDVRVTALKWKPDGKGLAVGWSDGGFVLYSGENGRLLSQGTVRGDGRERGWKLDLAPDFGVDDEDEAGVGVVVEGFSWVRHLLEGVADEAEPAPGDGWGVDLEDPMSTEDWHDDPFSEADEAEKKHLPGSKAGRSAVQALVKSIAGLDATNVMPKLSAIPAHGMRAGPDGNRFASQAAVDAVFETKKQSQDEGVDALLVCGSDGRVTVLQDDEVEIGSVNVGEGQIIACAFNSSYPTHAVLSRTGQDGPLTANFIDIPVAPLSSPLLHAVALNTKRFHNLLAYITHTVRCIQHDLSTGLTFPTRLLNNANMELAEKQEGDIVSNLFHLAMTTDFTDTMKEWLVDIVRETNHKRWDQAVNMMYTNIQNHVFINLLPALDRLSIAAGALRGHARFHDGTGKFDAEPQLFTNIMDSVDALRLVAKKIQLTIMSEHRQFRAFSKWLRVMIDVGVAGPGTKGAAETEEREVPNFDFPLILAYIKDILSRRSRLEGFVGQPSSLKGEVGRKEELFEREEMRVLGYEATKAALKRLDARASDEAGEEEQARDVMDPVLNVPAIAALLAAHVRVATERITKWQGKMLTLPTTIPVGGLGDATTRVRDVRMTAADLSAGVSAPRLNLLESPGEGGAGDVLFTQPIMVPSQSNPAKSVRSPNSRSSIKGNKIALSGYEGTADAKFSLDGTGTVILTKNTGSGDYVLLDGDQYRVIHTFPMDEGFVPENLVVGGRNGKEVVLVFGNSGKEWRLLDLAGKAKMGKGAEGTTDDFEMSGME